MKQLFTLIFTLLFVFNVGMAQDWSNFLKDNYGNSVFSNPQKYKAKIIEDKISNDGWRYIQCMYRCSYIGTSTSENSVFAYVCGMQSDSIEYINIGFIITSHDNPIRVKKNSPVLFKFGDNTVFESKSLNNSEDIIPNVRSAVVMGSVITVKDYKIHVFIPLTDELIVQLGKGLKKLRFELNGDIYDVSPRKDNLSQFIIDEYNLIKEALKEKRSFRDDF